MIILMGFKTFDEQDAEFHLTGPDAVRAASLVGETDLRNPPRLAIVTIFHQGLTDENCKENLREGASALGSEGGQDLWLDV